VKFKELPIPPQATPDTDIVLERVPMVYDKTTGDRRPRPRVDVWTQGTLPW
jgi:hypothetical protein